MKDSKKAVIIPIDNRILCLYKGYILNGDILPDVKESDLYTKSEIEVQEYPSKSERLLRIFVIVPLIPIILLLFIIATIVKKYDVVNYKIDKSINAIINLFIKQRKRVRTTQVRNNNHKNAESEDLPDFLNHCRKNFVKIFLYSYHPLTYEQDSKISELLKNGLISSCHLINRLSDLKPVISDENISIRNSLLIIKDPNEKNEARLLGFNPDNGCHRNVELLKKRRFSDEGGTGELEWNSSETFIGLKKKVEYYLKAKDKMFFDNRSILFIEDQTDAFLNNYIKVNLKKINRRLSEKGMNLMYFPSIQSHPSRINTPLLNFVRYRVPLLYSLTDNELKDVIITILGGISANDFYKMVLEELELPYFKRPCLLRSISGGFAHSENKFTYKPIEYSTKADLDEFFDGYFKQVKIPDDSEGIMYSLAGDPKEYDADWHFGKESNQYLEELKQKIDAIKDAGEYKVLVEALMYMLETIKEEKPELINKIRPLLEKRKLLESNVVLSPLLVDNHYNIFLTDFGNTEVKMHALPKSVYILFLRHPYGIRFKELYQYKPELLDIYNKVTNKYEKEEIERAITDLVDMTKPNINIQCSRIRASFRSLMDEHIARHYYIDGLNGEAKKISIPENLIDIRY